MLHFIGDFFYKTRPSLARAAFYRDFFIKPELVLHVRHFVGDFFYKTRSSLARAAFKRDFLYNQKGRRSIVGMAQQLC